MKKLMGNIIFLLLVAGFFVGVHAGFLYGAPYYTFKVFESNAKELERISFERIEQFKAKVIDQMKKDKVPIDFKKDLHKHLKVYADREGVMHAEITWTVHVDYYGYFPRDFVYEVEVIR